MKSKILINKTKYLLLTLIAIGAWLRYYNLNWGAPYYFHPDERNIAASVSQLQIPSQMNPNFFAYGSLPIYSIFISGIIKNLLAYCFPLLHYCFTLPASQSIIVQNPLWQKINRLSFEEAIIISRLFSATFSLMLIIIIYYTGKKLHSIKAGLIAAFLTSTSVGLIQYAHFGTFEMWLTFFSFLLFIVCLQLLRKLRMRYVLFSGVIMGILISTKISHLALIPIPVMCIALGLYKNILTADPFYKKIKFYLSGLTLLITFTLVTALVFIATNPYVFIDLPAFKNSMKYESGVALGSIEVFYTHEFFDTLPVVFQFLKIYPFLINPFLTAIFIPSLIYILWKAKKTKNEIYILLTSFYLLLFLSQAFLFVKWTRYMVPTLPFIYLIIAISFASVIDFTGKKIKNKAYQEYSFKLLIFFGILACTLFTFAYFKTVLVKTDSRILSSLWAKNNLNADSKILSETYDLGIIAFNSNFPHIALCNLYYLEKDQFPCQDFSFEETIKEANYVILPSERIMKMSILKPIRFPKRYKFYISLLKDKSRYKLIYKTPCDIYCKILYVGDTFNSMEQTTHVFDRPTVYIFENL